MKKAGLISLLSIPVAVLVCIVLSCFMDTSGFAAIGAAFIFTVIVCVAGVLSLIFGICAIRSGNDRNQGTVGVVFGLLVVGGAVSIVLFCYIYSYIEDKHIAAARAAEEKAEKAAYDASPDIDSNSIATLLESTHLHVEINDIAALPDGKILVYFDISGGRSGSRIIAFSVAGKQVPDFSFEKDEVIGFHRKRLLAAPNGDFLLVSMDMHGPDSFDRYGGCWTKEGPALLRNRHGKLTELTIDNSGEVQVARFAQSGKLYGIEWLPAVYRYDDNDEKVMEKHLAVNLVEMPFNGKAFRRKASLGTALLNQMHDYDLELLSPEDLFFWPNGDIGLVVSLSGDCFVHRFNPSGTRVLSTFKTGSESYSEQDHFLGFFPDGTLILSEKNQPDNMALYRRGKKVGSFSKALEKFRKRFDIQASAVISTGELVVAGSPHDKKNNFQFVIFDSSGIKRKRFVLGTDL